MLAGILEGNKMKKRPNRVIRHLFRAGPAECAGSGGRIGRGLQELRARKSELGC